jgi:hypothetical protein
MVGISLLTLVPGVVGGSTSRQTACQHEPSPCADRLLRGYRLDAKELPPAWLQQRPRGPGLERSDQGKQPLPYDPR